MGKVIRIPIEYKQRMINKYGQGYVPCEISGRWLQFPEESAFVGNEELMFVDVMTMDTCNDKPRKLCQLCVSREDILRALDNIKSENDRVDSE